METLSSPENRNESPSSRTLLDDVTHLIFVLCLVQVIAHFFGAGPIREPDG